jgi:site-specific recombinase XerD
VFGIPSAIIWPSRGRLHGTKGQHSIYWRGAKQFTEFLRAQQGIVATKAALAPPELVAAFEHWMQIHRGVKPSTLITYRQHVMDLLSSLDPQPEQFNATKLHGFILTYAKRNGRAVAQTRVKAARMFLRFLIATERCQPGLDAAIPTIAEWRLASLPRYLPPADVERVLEACNGARPIDIRDKAILLLLARLGLRASDVASLKFDDIDWLHGTFTVIGKSRHEAKLPLPQDVGDAILNYLRQARPLGKRRLRFYHRCRSMGADHPKRGQACRYACHPACRCRGAVVRFPYFPPFGGNRVAPPRRFAPGHWRSIAPPQHRHHRLVRQSRHRTIAASHQAVAGSDIMLKDALDTYLAVRHAAGFALVDDEHRLRGFVRFASAQGDTVIVAATAIAWAGQGRSESQRSNRLKMVIRFARFAHATDGRHEIPPQGVYCARRQRPTPYLYTENEIQALMAQALHLGPPGTLRAQTYSTLIGLLAATGAAYFRSHQPPFPGHFR